MDRAVDFFKRISAKCAGKCNCLYETWNEPVNVDWSSQVKPYHEKVLAVCWLAFGEETKFGSSAGLETSSRKMEEVKIIYPIIKRKDLLIKFRILKTVF